MGKPIAALRDYVQQTWPNDLSPLARHLLRQLYQRLAQGRPVEESTLLDAQVPNLFQLQSTLAEFPSAWLERDADNRIIACCGLSQRPTAHHIRLGEQALYAWCAWDCLFLPELLGQTLYVQSHCPHSKRVIELDIAPGNVIKTQPEPLWLSFVMPNANTRQSNLRQVFCRHIHFFATPDDYQQWSKNQPHSVLMTLAQGVELGSLRNRIVLGERLSF